jgi:hypothetical protein
MLADGTQQKAAEAAVARKADCRWQQGNTALHLLLPMLPLLQLLATSTCQLLRSSSRLLTAPAAACSSQHLAACRAMLLPCAA